MPQISDRARFGGNSYISVVLAPSIRVQHETKDNPQASDRGKLIIMGPEETILKILKEMGILDHFACFL